MKCFILENRKITRNRCFFSTDVITTPLTVYCCQTSSVDENTTKTCHQQADNRQYKTSLLLVVRNDGINKNEVKTFFSKVSPDEFWENS